MNHRRLQWVSDSAALGGPGGATSPAHFPRLSPIDEAIFFLHTAAEIEHSLMVQYLFAWWSVPLAPGDSPIPVAQRVGWANTIKTIAVQEMGHLMTVQNVLRAVGGPLTLDREDYPFRSDYYPFHFRLEPLSRKSVAKYVLAEMPEAHGLSAAELAEIQTAASEGGAPGVNRVGALFNTLLIQLGALPEGYFRRPQNDTVAFQGTEADWALGSEGMIIRSGNSRQSILDALTEIAAQGEGADAGVDSHYTKFLKIYRDLRTVGTAGPVRNMVINPNTAPAPLSEPEMEAGRITDPVAQAWAHLFDARYRRLLYCLLHHLHLPALPGDPGKRDDLRRWTFNEMASLSRIATQLVSLPAKIAGGPPFAGPAFQMPYTLAIPDQETDRWYGHCQTLDSARIAIEDVRLVDTNPQRLIVLAGIENTDAQRRRDVSERVDALQGVQPSAPDTCRRESVVAPEPRRIRSVRLLPPLAIARFGSAPSPMDNYDAVVVSAAGARQLRPAETLEVNAAGEIARAFTPATVQFRETGGQRIRPVCPFVEVWAQFTENGPFEPLQVPDVSPGDVRWRVRAANLKAARRTGDSNDRIIAETPQFSTHDPQLLSGIAGNFLAGKSILFGSVRYIRPNAAFPEIRLRFTPGTGKVYGHRANDPNTVDRVYDASRGRWDGFREGMAGAPQGTVPGQIFARAANNTSLGYLDDSCDAVVEVEVVQSGQTFKAVARLTVGPPGFAPDSFHVRTMNDDLRQAIAGPEVTATTTLDPDEVIDLVRRALETMRLMNVADLNQNASSFLTGNATQAIFTAAQGTYKNAIQTHTAILNALQGLKAAAGTPQRTAAVVMLQQIVSRLRRFDQTDDTTPDAMRLMPALMRSADAGLLAVTRRQRSVIERAVVQFAAAAAPSGPEASMLSMIASLEAIATVRHGLIQTDSGGSLSDLFTNPPSVLQYLRTATIRGAGAPANLTGRPLIVPGQPDQSPFVQLLQTAGHPMQPVFAELQPGTGKTRLQIVREWIAALTS